MTTQNRVKRPLRADAARNQARILKAAREVFGSRGLDVSLDEVAQHAGLGVATLYRRYPDRESLISALFETELRNTVERARAALEIPNAWEAFTVLLRSIFSAVAEDKGFRQALLSSRHSLGAATPIRRELIGLLSLVIARAQGDGRLRAEVTARDIPPMMLMIGIVADFTSNSSPQLWHRYSALLIDGLSTRKNPPPLAPDPLSEAQMELAFSRW